MNQQISLARTGKLDQAMAIAGQVDEILSQVDSKQRAEIASDTVIRDLYNQLGLIISAEKNETATELSGIRKGKNTLRAYKDISSR
ncbi:MAG: hypothetical protein HN350_05020 [Phycisphaerales bacterium]|nr:hypothetical protein [Phycisphaerales bacterium]